MTGFESAVRAVAKGNVVIVGVGNALKADDAAGPVLAETLRKRFPDRVFDAGQVPENYLGPIRRARPDTILLEGIQIPAALGVTAAERRMRRPVTLDLEVVRPLDTAGRSDNIRHTIHYKRIFEVVEDVAGNQEHKLVEALAQRIAKAVLEKFDADAITITVRKPTPIGGVLQHAGVRVRRTRDQV